MVYYDTLGPATSQAHFPIQMGNSLRRSTFVLSCFRAFVIAVCFVGGFQFVSNEVAGGRHSLRMDTE